MSTKKKKGNSSDFPFSLREIRYTKQRDDFTLEISPDDGGYSFIFPLPRDQEGKIEKATDSTYNYETSDLIAHLKIFRQDIRLYWTFAELNRPYLVK